MLVFRPDTDRYYVALWQGLTNPLLLIVAPEGHLVGCRRQGDLFLPRGELQHHVSQESE